MKKIHYLIPVLSATFAISVLLILLKQPSDEGIEILGHHYSATLRDLYERVCTLHKKPIRILEIKGHVEDSIEPLHEKEIVLKLHRGCSEDNIAHELMHAVMCAEGYPGFFCISTSSLSVKIRRVCRGDLDHIIINDRLLELGYDARQGFLKEANGYDNFLQLDAAEGPNRQAVRQFGVLHMLLKYHYYIGSSSAQTDILKHYPEVTKYWEILSFSIDGLPAKPKPQDMWHIGTQYITLGDAICDDLGASIRISDLIGLHPLPLHRDQLSKAAKSIFSQTSEDIEQKLLGKDSILLRTFLANPRIMLSAHVVWANDPRVGEINRLSVTEFLQERNIRHILYGL